MTSWSRLIIVLHLVDSYTVTLISLQLTDDYCFVVFGVINVVWATVYLEAWKRRSAEHAYKWGTLDCEDELLVEPRPLHHVRPVSLPPRSSIYNCWFQ